MAGILGRAVVPGARTEPFPACGVPSPGGAPGTGAPAGCTTPKVAVPAPPTTTAPPPPTTTAPAPPTTTTGG